jgi:hypothetical protein
VPEPPSRSPVEQAVAHAADVLVYAPIGLLFDGASVLEQLATKGRDQVSTARVIGRFAVTHGRTEAVRALGRLQDQAAGLLDFLGTSLSGTPAPEPAPPPRRGPAPAPAPARATDPAVGSSADLAIPDYDGLSASQVVNRLAGLSASELDSVQRYEAATRGRKTILSKVAQLQGA